MYKNSIIWDRHSIASGLLLTCFWEGRPFARHNCCHGKGITARWYCNQCHFDKSSSTKMDQELVLVDGWRNLKSEKNGKFSGRCFFKLMKKYLRTVWWWPVWSDLEWKRSCPSNQYSLLIWIVEALRIRIVGKWAADSQVSMVFGYCAERIEWRNCRPRSRPQLHIQ